MTTKTPTARAFRSKWSLSVKCPSCDSEAKSTKRLTMPMWRCPVASCDFHHGWRLVPFQGVILCVPTDGDLSADPSEDPDQLAKAMVWGGN